MLDILFVALFQAAAGAPDAAPPASETATQQPAPEGGAQPAAQTTAANAVDAAHKRTCHRIQVTGSRLATTVCSTPHDDEQAAQEARDTLHTPMTTMPSN